MSALEVPDAVSSYLRDAAGGPAWVDSVVGAAHYVAEAWGLTLGAVLPGGMVSLVVEATTCDGTDAVLKLQFPHRECEHEAAALQLWAGNGAIRLLEHDEHRHALLLERCRPGDRLSESLDGDDALDVIIQLLGRLLVPAGAPFGSLTDEAQRWVTTLRVERGRYFDPGLTDLAIDLLTELAATQRAPVLVHQDLHGDNVLRAEREPWLAIDPKPVLGEPEFAVAPVVRSSELGHSKGEALHRLDRLCDELLLDRDRARSWTIAQTIAWSSTSSMATTHHETVRWLLEEN